MNKKELADIRKEFKLENGMIKIEEIYSVYLKKDNVQIDYEPIIHSEFDYFDRMDMDKKELFLGNFKKVLTGALDTKIFELDFQNIEDEDNSQKFLTSALKSNTKDEIENNINIIINKIAANYKYETDVVVTFIKAEYYIGSSHKNMDADESIQDSMNAFNFILSSVNKIDIPKRTLKFDYTDKEFKANSVLDSVINLNAPLEGFMFPSLSGGCSDFNKCLYYASKPKELNSAFIENVLNCGFKFTAEDEKNCFGDILKSIIGDKIKPELMQDIYANIHELAEQSCDGETPILGVIDVKNILSNCGAEIISDIETAFEETCGSKYDFKINNIVPEFNSKSIKITSEIANITLTPKDLNSIKQVRNKDGRRCLLIEIEDDIIIEGFKLETEEF
ncbi:DUF4317 family protein [Clostridium estertheticum]|uniref:DUF4317 family protein n=1 Tax=Clostridium estertheticum TaxID=238834 RepID=UPI001C7E192A|nr:DUF4317 family protein [Clostridium estertheticum]MBX4266257.1 DUF4317 domain-containing protein [Clostridium estertheticum]MBX4268849.1 DUF4317 domain-containing protein [Clostridium estertheticum]WLC78955.1 DUF4317 domain-containing protein [Clostridium estertheticum]WLC89956.1 DUF4317 domain-containing protein [Clostridium estertheticum]